MRAVVLEVVWRAARADDAWVLFTVNSKFYKLSVVVSGATSVS